MCCARPVIKFRVQSSPSALRLPRPECDKLSEAHARCLMRSARASAACCFSFDGFVVDCVFINSLHQGLWHRPADCSRPRVLRAGPAAGSLRSPPPDARDAWPLNSCGSCLRLQLGAGAPTSSPAGGLSGRDYHRSFKIFSLPSTLISTATTWPHWRGRISDQRNCMRRCLPA